MPMQMSLPGLITLGEVELTDEGRQPLNTETEERGTTVELASGKKRKYIKTKIWRTWTISWENVPRSATETVDGKGARDEISALAFAPGNKALSVTEDDDTTETYTVFVESYTEEITARRRYAEGFRYNVTLTLTEAE